MFGALSLLVRQVSGEMKGAAIVSPAKDNSPFGRFGALTRIMNVGLLVLDSATALEFANPLACDLLGCANEEDLKGRWESMKPLLGLDKDLPRTTKPRPLKVNLPLPDKIRFLRLEIYALEEESCTGYLVLMKDRQMVDVLETDLLLASQMRSQTHLYGALAHDLRAPLNAMQITLELLADTLISGGAGADTSDQQRYVAVLKEEVARLNRTLCTMLDHSIPLSAASQKFDLRAIVEEVAALLGTQAKRHRVDLQLRLPDREVKVIGHRDRLKQALINVAINGLEAMPGGGRLRIDMVVPDSTVNIIVRDDGPGIANELLDEIYQIYFTTKKSGSGMGLYVARLVLESHGGDIQVVNQPGSGACFTLTLPLAEKPGAR
jgi:signal transduction histidine kinase